MGRNWLRLATVRLMTSELYEQHRQRSLLYRSFSYDSLFRLIKVIVLI